MSDSRVRVTDEMLRAGVDEFGQVTDMGQGVEEVTPLMLRDVYIAMRSLEPPNSQPVAETSASD